jgi:hypothetical protein
MKLLLRPIQRTFLGCDECEDAPWVEVHLDDLSASLRHLRPPDSSWEIRFAPATPLTSIDGFHACHWLVKVEVPASVEIVDIVGFHSSISLSRVIFEPNSCLRLIHGFSFCRSLLKIAIPASVEVIHESAFFECHSLYEVTFARHSCLKSLLGFRGCHSLLRITIPASVEYIDDDSFHDGRALSEVILEGSSSFERISMIVRMQLSRIECQRDFPDLGLESLPAFLLPVLLVRRTTHAWSLLLKASDDCYLLDEPFFAIESIPAFVFAGGQRLNVSAISDRLLCLCASRAIPIPPFIRIIGSCCRSIECIPILDIPASVECIDGFLQVAKLETVEFTTTNVLREIRGFSGCVLLRAIVIPPSVERILGFNQCRSLERVEFVGDSHLRVISGFSYCIRLAEIHFPRAVTRIHGFNKCKGLARMGFDENGVLEDLHGFGHCRMLCAMEIPSSVRALIGFDKCTQLQRIVFARYSRLTMIEGFQYCTSLAEIEVPSSVQSIVGFGLSALHRISLGKGTRIMEIRRTNDSNPYELPTRGIFVDYAKLDLKSSRRLMWIQWDGYNLTHVESDRSS